MKLLVVRIQNTKQLLWGNLGMINDKYVVLVLGHFLLPWTMHSISIPDPICHVSLIFGLVTHASLFYWVRSSPVSGCNIAT